MKTVHAIYRNGKLELTEPVDWPEETRVEVSPVLMKRGEGPSWIDLPPLDVGEFRELTSDDDLLGEMLDDSRS